MEEIPPNLEIIRRVAADLAPAVVRTPLLRCADLEAGMSPGTRLWGKCEFLQKTGTFKARGALASVAALAPAQRAGGLTAVSAGNHAIATSYAASVFGTTAKVVMPKNAYRCRIEACRRHGGEVILAADVHEAFDIAEAICRDEGRQFIHPFEGPAVAAGTGTLGLELCEQRPDLDAIVVAVGGGGLLGGIANAVKQVNPRIEVIGVEPEGADSMHRSLAQGAPASIDTVSTIADSLGAPYALPYSFALCRDNVDRWCRVDDNSLKTAMRELFQRQRIAVEPACAATTAAALGPLRRHIAGKNVALLFCGSNIDWETFRLLANAGAAATAGAGASP
jgi:threonine dehydratase